MPLSDWDFDDVATDQPHRPFAGIVISGLISRQIDVGGHPGLELYGSGDVFGTSRLTWTALPSSELWCATCRLALLDDRFLLAARHWPELVGGLFEKCREQHDRLLLQLAVAVQPRVDDRLLLLFWHLVALL